MATMSEASVSAPFFQQHLLISCLCQILVISAVFQTFYSQMVICDWWSLMLLLPRDYDLLKAQMMLNIFNNKLFLS